MPDIKAESQKPLWTPARLAFTIVVLSLFATFAVSSCNSNDETRTTAPTPANTPAVTVHNDRASQPVLTTLPAYVLDSECRALNAAPITLTKYDATVLPANLWATW